MSKDNVSAEDLRNWVDNLDTYSIHDVLEFLLSNDCLNKRGISLSYVFWKKYIKAECEQK